MAANRKLLGEIQQVLKKYEEGVLLFDDIWEKVYAAGQQSLKEKYESDLKKEIKKLQRLRDQIKTWIGSAEVKDKTQLIEARKVIETKMEQFKICEKDTKTKAYSKEGLARDSKVDPKEAMREEKRNWINECLERLNDVINSIEADKEKLLNAKGSKTKNKEQIEKFDNRIQKNKWHINKLEVIIKLLDNEDLDPASLDSVKENLEYYLETAVEDDGAVGVEEEFDIYEDLNLDALVSSTVVAIPAAFDLSPRGSTPAAADSFEPSSTATATASVAGIDSTAPVAVHSEKTSISSDSADGPTAAGVPKKGNTLTFLGGISVGAGKATAPPSTVVASKPTPVSAVVTGKEKAVPVVGTVTSTPTVVKAPATAALPAPKPQSKPPGTSAVSSNAPSSVTTSVVAAANVNITPSPKKAPASNPPVPPIPTIPPAEPTESVGEAAVAPSSQESEEAFPISAPPLSWAHAAAPSASVPKSNSNPNPTFSSAAATPTLLPNQSKIPVAGAALASLPNSSSSPALAPLTGPAFPVTTLLPPGSGKALGSTGSVVGGSTISSNNIPVLPGSLGLGGIGMLGQNPSTIPPLNSDPPSLSSGGPGAFTNSIIGPSSVSSHPPPPPPPPPRLNAASAMNSELAVIIYHLS